MEKQRIEERKDKKKEKNANKHVKKRENNLPERRVSKSLEGIFSSDAIQKYLVLKMSLICSGSLKDFNKCVITLF